MQLFNDFPVFPEATALYTSLQLVYFNNML